MGSHEQHTAATMFQYRECRRLVVLRDGEEYWFAPEGPPPHLLHSHRGSRWPRTLIGHWRNGQGELSWDSSAAPDDDEHAFLTDFASWEELHDLYQRPASRKARVDRREDSA